MKTQKIIIVLSALSLAMGAVVWWRLSSTTSLPREELIEGVADVENLAHTSSVISNADPTAYLQSVRAVVDRVRAVTSADVAAGLDESLRAVVEDDVEAMFAVWRNQGRELNPRSSMFETGDIQDKHDRRRAMFLTASLDASGIEVTDPKDAEQRYASSKVRSNSQQLDCLRGRSSPPSENVFILIPATLTGLNGEPFEGALGVGLVYHPGQERWIMRSFGVYGPWLYNYLVPLF